MTTLILLVLFGILSAVFATQNTTSSSITLFGYIFSGVPMYLIVLGALLVGLLLSSIITLVNSISSSLTILGKDSTIKATKKTNSDLTKRLKDLEVENAQLRGEKNATSILKNRKAVVEE